jgi:hypothetical protein
VPRDARVVILVVTLARVVYQVFFSPYELVADEAQYWDWSRRLDLSYYSKGPGIAWLIRGSTTLFGVSEWSVRLPAALSFAATSAIVASLAAKWARQPYPASAAIAAVFLLTLVPAYQLSALLMTIDAPYITCWALAILAAWRAYTQERLGRPSLAAWTLCGLAVGVGFLFKYSMILIVPGLVWFAWRERGALRPGVGSRAAAAAAVALICALPVIVWNVSQQGAGLAHLLGYLELRGGDRPARFTFQYDPLWTLSFLAAQLAIVGPALVLTAIAGARRRGTPEGRLAIGTALPMLLTFLLATVRAPAEGNWPIAAYVGIVPLAVTVAGEERHRAAPRLWQAAFAYGLVAMFAIHAPLAVASLPWVGRFVPTIRFTGFAEGARTLARPIGGLTARHGGPAPLLVATSHNAAGLLAFYLPGRPVVASAGRFLGDRPSAYDFFSDTNLSGNEARGRPLLLIGGTTAQWQQWDQVFVLEEFRLLSPTGPIFAARRFDGPRAAR